MVNIYHNSVWGHVWRCIHVCIYIYISINLYFFILRWSSSVCVIKTCRWIQEDRCSWWHHMKDVKTNPSGAAHVAISKDWYHCMEREAVKLGAGGLGVELRCGCWDLVNILTLNTCWDLHIGRVSHFNPPPPLKLRLWLSSCSLLVFRETLHTSEQQKTSPYLHCYVLI